MHLRTWIRDVSDRADAASWTNLEIWRAFKASGIEIPFPQRVVHMADEGEGHDLPRAEAGSPPPAGEADPRILEDVGGEED